MGLSSATIQNSVVPASPGHLISPSGTLQATTASAACAGFAALSEPAAPTEGVTAASDPGTGSLLSAQLVETLKAANGPPAAREISETLSVVSAQNAGGEGTALIGAESTPIGLPGVRSPLARGPLDVNPDLVITGSAQFTSPVFVNDTLSFSYTVTNQGTGPTTADSWWDAIYFGDQSTFPFPQYESQSAVKHTGVLAAGASYTGTITYNLYSGQFDQVLTGNWYFHLVTDSPLGYPPVTAVTEGNEANNVSAAIPATFKKAAIDLAPLSSNVASSVELGALIGVELTVRNSGTDPATGVKSLEQGSPVTTQEIWAEVYRSADNVFDEYSDTWLAAAPVLGGWPPWPPGRRTRARSPLP